MAAGAISQNDSAFVQRWTKAIWSLIILSAVVVRLPEIGRPFWLDEAWVVNSALTPSLRDSFRYDTWLQTSPPMFLIALRIAHKVFGGLEIPFRTIPFAFSAAAVLLALLLGKRLFGPVAGSFLGAVTAVSPILVSLSGQVKQYSSDLCCALLLMILIWDYFQDPTRGNYTRLLIAFLVCLPLAYTTVMFLPLAGIVLLAATTNHRTTIVRTALFTLLTSGMFLALEVLFIRPNQSPELLAYWYSQSAFPPRGNWSYKFYRDGFRDAFYMFYSRSGFLSRLFGVLGVCGFVSLLCSVRNARPRLLLALACLPILTVLALNRLLLYPFYAEKQDIIIFPCLAVLVLYGATKIAGLLTLSGRVEIILQTVLIGVCVALTMTASWFDFRNPLD